MKALRQMRITATVVMDFVVADDEELDAVCEDIHMELGAVMVGNDWTGSVELSWAPVPAAQAPDAATDAQGEQAGRG